MAERPGQRGRGKPGFGDQQAAGGLLVEPVHQPRLLSLGVAHHFQHVVDIAGDAGAALHRKPGRLVQHHDVGILEQDHVLERLQRLVLGFRQMAGNLGRIQFERRNPDALAFLDPVLAVGALAVDAQLALPDDALDVGKRQAGKARLEKAVDPHVVLVRRHHDGLDFGRQRRRLGNDLFGLGDERRRSRRARRGGCKTRRGLATRTMRLRL